MKKLRYGLIGCGQAGRVHAYHFARQPEIEPVVCVDTALKRAETVKNELSFQNACEDPMSALDSLELDLVSIATPPSEHARQILAAAGRGIHILCEKPLVISPDDIRPLSTLCREKGIRLAVMLPRRFYNNTRATGMVLAEKALGRVTRVHFTLECRKENSYYEGWRGRREFAGGGVLMSQAIHSTDQLCYFFGRPAIVEGRTWQTRQSIEVEDEAEGRIEFENGVTVSLRATTNSTSHLWRGLTEIKGEKGRIVLDSERIVEWQVPEVTPPPPEEAEEVPSGFKPSYYGPGHLKVIRNFIDSLTRGGTLGTPFERSWDTLKLIWGFYRSSEGKRPIALDA